MDAILMAASIGLGHKYHYAQLAQNPQYGFPNQPTQANLHRPSFSRKSVLTRLSLKNRQTQYRSELAGFSKQGTAATEKDLPIKKAATDVVTAMIITILIRLITMPF